MINNHFFVTGSHSDNALDLWIMNKKKPIFSLKNCHKPGSWLLSTASVKSSDLIASGGYDGNVNFYTFDKNTKSILKTHSLSGFDGCINAMKYSHVKGT